LNRLSRVHQQREREQSREAQINAASYEAYRLARIDRRTRHFIPDTQSGDAAIAESHDLMHARIRNNRLNVAQVTRIVEALTDLVVGTGIQTFASPLDPWANLTAISDDELDQFLRSSLEMDDVFCDWFEDPAQFDIAGKLSGYDVQRMMFSENVEVGDGLLLRCHRKPQPGRVSLCYQLLERDQLDCSKDRPAAPGQNKIVNGIELDKWGREVAYHIYEAHPYDYQAHAGLSQKSERIPADRVIHLFGARRPSQNVGVTWLHAIGQNALDRESFISSELQAAAKQALIALVAKRDNPNTGTLGLADTDTSVDGDTDALGNEEIKLGTSPIAAEIGVNESVDLVEANRPNSTSEPFINMLDRDTAGGTGLSIYTLNGDMSRTNYTGFRGAILIEDQHIRPIQNFVARNVVIPIRRRFNVEAAASGLYSTVSASEFFGDMRRYQRVDALAPGREMLDPENETEAAIGRMRSALSNLKIECARRGLHWIRVLLQAKLENRLAQTLGVVLDFSKGQGETTKKTTREKETADAQGAA